MSEITDFFSPTEPLITLRASAVVSQGMAMTAKDREFERLLIEADVLTKAHAWRFLLHAHDHVWRDREWNWRTRFDAAGMLWDKALAVCKENMLGRARRVYSSPLKGENDGY